MRNWAFIFKRHKELWFHFSKCSRLKSFTMTLHKLSWARTTVSRKHNEIHNDLLELHATQVMGSKVSIKKKKCCEVVTTICLKQVNHATQVWNDTFKQTSFLNIQELTKKWIWTHKIQPRLHEQANFSFKYSSNIFYSYIII